MATDEEVIAADNARQARETHPSTSDGNWSEHQDRLPVKERIIRGARRAVDRVSDFVEERQEAGRQADREQYYTKKDYILDKQYREATENASGPGNSTITYAEAKLFLAREKRHKEIDDLMYADARIKARDAQKKSQTSSGISVRVKSGKASNLSPAYDLGDEFFGVGGNQFAMNPSTFMQKMGDGGGTGKGGMPPSEMFAVPRSTHPSAARSPSRRGGHMARPIPLSTLFDSGGNRKPLPSGADLFGLGGMVGVNDRPSQKHSVGHPMRPNDLFAPSDLFGIGGGSSYPGKAPRGSQPAGYDGRYDMFGNEINGRGADLFGRSQMGDIRNPFGDMSFDGSNPFGRKSVGRRPQKSKSKRSRR